MRNHSQLGGCRTKRGCLALAGPQTLVFRLQLTAERAPSSLCPAAAHVALSCEGDAPALRTQ